MFGLSMFALGVGVCCLTWLALRKVESDRVPERSPEVKAQRKITLVTPAIPGETTAELAVRHAAIIKRLGLDNEARWRPGPVVIRRNRSLN